MFLLPSSMTKFLHFSCTICYICVYLFCFFLPLAGLLSGVVPVSLTPAYQCLLRFRFASVGTGETGLWVSGIPCQGQGSWERSILDLSLPTLSHSLTKQCPHSLLLLDYPSFVAFKMAQLGSFSVFIWHVGNSCWSFSLSNCGLRSWYTATSLIPIPSLLFFFTAQRDSEGKSSSSLYKHTSNHGRK